MRKIPRQVARIIPWETQENKIMRKPKQIRLGPTRWIIRNLPELRNLLNNILDLGLEYYRQGSWSGRSIKKGSREIRDFLFWGTSCELDSQLFYAGVCICIKLFLKYLNLFKLN